MNYVDRDKILSLDRARDRPLHQQIRDQLREAVTTGQLRPGERLPSARSLADQLGVARGTVDAAYGALAGEGYLVGRGSAGTFVVSHLRMPKAGRRPLDPIATVAPPSPAAQADPDRPPEADMLLPFRICLPAFDAFPRKLWARLTIRRARSLSTGGLVYPGATGLPALKQAIAAYLAVSRGLSCRPAQVIVTGGYQAGLTLIAMALMRSGDAIWFEDPGYVFARRALETAGAALVPVPVDDEGLRVADGMARCPGARFAVVTPSHQSPLGVALSLPRRLALLAWAAEAGAWVIEDDYDSEFRYVGRPLPALKSLDHAGRVIYAGTFSKVLFPGLRLGYLVVPETETGRFTASSQLLHGGLPILEQSVVADAMAQGHFARHLKRMRGLYAARRRALTQALRATFGTKVEIDLQAGGMHLLARFPSADGDVELAAAARRQGLWPTPLSTQAVEPAGRQGLLLGFTNVDEAQAAEASRRLEAAIGHLL